MIHVLFVCLGNICRSPMAEAVFRQLVIQKNLTDKISVDSAGTASWHEGKPPHEGTREKLAELNISYDGITARQVKEEDFNTFDYIITMDDDNLNNIVQTYGEHNNVVLRKLLDFVPELEEENVPDPYYTGDFNYTYELINEASERLLTHIMNEGKLERIE